MELIPGVQEGARLTMNGLDTRLAGVEKTLSQLVVDFYEPTSPHVEQEVTGLRHQVDHLREQRDQVNPILELKDARISELESLLAERDATIRRQKEQITTLSVDIDEYVRENDNLCEDNANLLEERDNLVVQLNNVRAVIR